MTRRLTPLSG